MRRDMFPFKTLRNSTIMKTGKSTSKCTEGVIGHAGGKKNLHLLRYKQRECSRRGAFNYY